MGFSYFADIQKYCLKPGIDYFGAEGHIHRFNVQSR
jgi:hypothetical protein